MNKNYVKPQIEVAVLEGIDVLTFSTENYVDWSVQNWFNSNDGTGYGPWDSNW